MTAPPNEVPPLVPISVAGIPSTTYRAYPITDHIADKLCAMIEIHHRADGQPQPSSHYHDLADLAAFARTTVVDAHALIRALHSEADRRGLQLPDRLTIPDPTWGPGYARVARDNPRLADRNVTQALRTAAALLDPVLTRSAAGTWDPVHRSWSER
jgi:hypothetical protein